MILQQLWWFMAMTALMVMRMLMITFVTMRWYCYGDSSGDIMDDLFMIVMMIVMIILLFVLIMAQGLLSEDDRKKRDRRNRLAVLNVCSALIAALKSMPPLLAGGEGGSSSTSRHNIDLPWVTLTRWYYTVCCLHIKRFFLSAQQHQPTYCCVRPDSLS